MYVYMCVHVCVCDRVCVVYAYGCGGIRMCGCGASVSTHIHIPCLKLAYETQPRKQITSLRILGIETKLLQFMYSAWDIQFGDVEIVLFIAARC